MAFFSVSSYSFIYFAPVRREGGLVRIVVRLDHVELICMGMPTFTLGLLKVGGFIS